MHEAVIRRNNVHTRGEGSQPMVFAHGFGCDQNMWRFVTPAFEDDYQVILFDYVGAGRSDVSAYNSKRYGSLQGYAQDILDVCEALALEDVIFVGHSVSSIIGILAAKRAPERFNHLVLVGPSPCYINDDDGYVGGFQRDEIAGLLDMMEKNYIGWTQFLAPVIMQNADRPALAQELEESFCSTEPHIAGEFARVTFFADNRADLADVTIPSLILQCSNDAIAPVSVGQYMHRHLPNSQLHELSVTGHCPHMSHPEETIEAIRAYLKRKSVR